MSIRSIETAAAPRPNGHYSQAVVYAGLVYVSLQLPIRPVDGSLPESLEEQAEQVLRNCARILEAAGSGLHRSLSVTIYLTDVSDWNAVNTEFERVFGDHRPARGVVAVAGLHLGARVGVQVVGAVSEP